MIFDHYHKIPQSTHLFQLCFQDVMSRGNISFNYFYFSSIYTSAARLLSCSEILCSLKFTGKIPPPPKKLLYKVLCVQKALLGHYISFSMLLYQTMTSSCSNCFQTWRAEFSFYFPFRYTGEQSNSIQQKADHEKRHMMSCRQNTAPKSYDQLSRKLSLSPLISFAIFSWALSFFMILAAGKSSFFFFFFPWSYSGGTSVGMHLIKASVWSWPMDASTTLPLLCPL